MRISARPERPSGLLGLPISSDFLLAAVAVAALVHIPWMGTRAALLFVMAGTGLIALRPLKSANELVAHWYLLLLPLYSTASALWSQFPALSLRFGVQLTVTVAVSIVVARRLSPRHFIMLLFVFLGETMVASLLFGFVRSDGAWQGVYASKNALAGAAAMLVVMAAGLVLDAGLPKALRTAAALMLALAFFMLVKAQSTGALILVFPVLLAQIALVFLPGLSPATRQVAAIFLVLALALAALLLQSNADVLVDRFLDATGKDITLTGRTDLWREALRLIGERPLFGVGYQAFWVKGYGPAEELWYMFGIKARSGFHFHNTYISNAVEIGIVGVALQIFVLYGAAWSSGVWAIRRRSAESSILFALVLLVIAISMIEVPVFFQFSPRTLIVFGAFVYAGRARRAARPKE